MRGSVFMKKQRILSWFLCAVMLLSLLPSTALAADTTGWLGASGNELYVGGVPVTSENAGDITGTGITSGTASFTVEGGVPTLVLDGVTIKDGYKDSDYGDGEWYNKIYGIYFKSADKEVLKIKFSGENVIAAEKPEEKDAIYGVSTHSKEGIAFEGDKNAKLRIESERAAVYSKGALSMNGGEYNIKTVDDDYSSGEALYCSGPLTIENANMKASADKNRGIWMRSLGDEDITLIKDSTLKVTGGTVGTAAPCEAIFSWGDIVIENSTVDATGDGCGIYAEDGKAITVSGGNSVITAKSVGGIDGYRKEQSAAILTGKESYGEDGHGQAAEITLNDGLAVTVPDAGSIGLYNFNGYGSESYRTALDAKGNYAREVIIKTPTTHCVCGKEECSSHSGTITHVAENSLNLVSGITGGATLSGGSYYLSDDLDAGENTIYASGTVNLCLNGHNLKGRICPTDDAVLNICDCKDGGKIENQYGHVINYECDNATVNIYGGTFESVHNEANTIIDFEGYSGNTLNLYGGTVKAGNNNSLPPIGTRTLEVNLYGGKISTAKAHGVVVLGKVNLCGNTEIDVSVGYAGIKVYGKELIDANGYTGGNISILCDRVSDGDVLVKNVTDATAGKFKLFNTDDRILNKVGNDLKYCVLYTVSFDSNGGDGTMANVRVPSGEYELPQCTFTAPERKLFKAWNVGGVEYSVGAKINITNDTTVTAVWKWMEKTTVVISEDKQVPEYDGNQKNFVVSGNVGDGFAVKYYKGGAEIPAPADAGKYDVLVKRAEDDIYKAYEKIIPNGLEITPKEINGAVRDDFEPMTYNGSEQTPRASVKADGLTVTGEWSTVTNVSDKTTFTANGNFTGTIENQQTGMMRAPQSAPESPTAVNESIEGKGDGKIVGVDDTMEYKADSAEEYTAVVGSEVSNLPVGTYKVRYKETDNCFVGEDKTVVIGVGGRITVKFDSNGGSAVEDMVCGYNQTVNEPEKEPTRAGYEFAGWFADSGLTNEWNFETDRFTQNTILYAKWVCGTVSRDEWLVGKAEAEGLNDIAKAEKSDIKLVIQMQEATEGSDGQSAIKDAAGARRNFAFYDISLIKNGSDAITEAPSVIEIKLPYQFTKKKNIQVYRYHGGNVQELVQLTERDTEKPYEDGKCFVDMKNGYIYIYSGKFSAYSVVYDKITSSSSGSGSRTASYTVKFETNGASAVKNQTVAQNGTVTEPAKIEREGYQFGGWYLDRELTEKYDFNAKVTKDITLYAKWIEVKQDDVGKHDCLSENFGDLDINMWYHLDTDYVLSEGLMKGMSEKTFAPNGKLTRAMLVTILYRNEGEPAISKNSSFADVKENTYYANAVSWAQQNGIVKGISETEFAPNEFITREQIAAIMHRYAKFKQVDVSVGESTNILSYSDFGSISEYAVAPLQWAVGAGLIKGRSETTLNPKDNATRAEIAAILHRFLESK